MTSIAREPLATPSTWLGPELLRSDDFYGLAHRELFAVLAEIHGEGGTPDPVLLTSRLRKHDKLADMTPAAFLRDIMAQEPASWLIGEYAAIIRRTFSKSG